MPKYYETDTQVNEYLVFHYADIEQTLRWEFGPHQAFGFHARLADCIDASQLLAESRALDLGCAVGRTSFDLSRRCSEVLGIDFSHAFIDTANRILKSIKGGIDPLLNAALIIIDKDALGVEQITGVIQSVGSSTLELTPEADTVCGVAISLLTVDLTSDVDIWTITITNDSYTIVPDGTLQEQQTVFMNGTCELTGYQTDNVAIIEDERP